VLVVNAQNGRHTAVLSGKVSLLYAARAEEQVKLL